MAKCVFGHFWQILLMLDKLMLYSREQKGCDWIANHRRLDKNEIPRMVKIGVDLLLWVNIRAVNS